MIKSRATIQSKNYLLSFLFLIVFACVILEIYSARISYAAFNPQINYQAKLTASTTVAVANGSYNIRFKLYTAESGGSPIWTEEWCKGDCAGGGDGVDRRIAIVSGLFSTLLGSTTVLTGVDFNQTLYLGVEAGGFNVNASWDGEMTPRKKLGTVPSAFVARTLNGYGDTQFIRSDTANATNTANTALTITQDGAGNIANLFGPSSAPVLVVKSNGNVGIGTTSPATTLSVHGNSYVSGTVFFGGAITATSTLNVSGATTLLSTLNVSGNLTLANTINGPLQANAGLVSATSSIGVLYGGTGKTTFTSGQLVYGSGTGALQSVATGTVSSSGSVSVTAGRSAVGGALAIDLNMANANTWTALQTFGNASTTQIGSTGSAYFATTAGNVGVGATTPPGSTAKLFVSSTLAGTIPLSVYGVPFSAGFPVNMELLDSSAMAQNVGGGIAFGGNDGVITSRWWSQMKGGKENGISGNYAGYLSFSTRAAGAGIITEQMRITSTGNVGIRTTSPQTLLHLNGSSATIRIENSDFSGASKWTNLKHDGSGNFIIENTRTGGGAGTGEIIFKPNNAEAMRLSSVGNVGIGTTTPTQKLDVAGNIALGSRSDGYGRIFLNQKTARTYPTVVMVGADDGSTNELNFGGGTSVGYITKKIQFHTAANDTTTGNSVRMTILSDGNVGIGTTTPSKTLSVQGTGIFSGGVSVATLTATGTVTMGTISSDGGLIYSSGNGVLHSVPPDLAEYYPTKDTSLQAGEIVALDFYNSIYVTRANNSNKSSIIGIISTLPGVALGQNENTNPNEKNIPIALAGRVPTKVNTEGGAISIGDKITLSSVPGVGKKATTASQSVGIALEPYNGTKEGSILVFIQNEQYGGTDLSTKTSSDNSSVSTVGVNNTPATETMVTSTTTSSASTAETEFMNTAMGRIQKLSDIVDELGAQLDQLASSTPPGVNMAELASSTANTLAQSDSFLERVWNLIVAKFAEFGVTIDRAFTRVTSLFVGTIKIEDKLCVDDICLSNDQLKALLIQAGGTSTATTTAPVIPTVVPEVTLSTPVTNAPIVETPIITPTETSAIVPKVIATTTATSSATTTIQIIPNATSTPIIVVPSETQTVSSTPIITTETPVVEPTPETAPASDSTLTLVPVIGGESIPLPETSAVVETPTPAESAPAPVSEIP